MADALNVAVSVMKTAGEGGPWGMATLAMYMVDKKENQSLADYLDTEVFASQQAKTLKPKETGVLSFSQYMERYKEMLHVERAAVDHLD
jgi:hypothetical protein